MTTIEDPRPQTPIATHRQGPHNGDPDPCPTCDGPRVWYETHRKEVVYFHAHCNACSASRSRDWRANNRQKSRDSVANAQFIRKYGVTKNQRDAAIAARDNRCDICGQKPKGNRKEHLLLVLDHDHETGELRGLPCGYCNRMLAWFEKYGEAAARYLANPPGLMPNA